MFCHHLVDILGLKYQWGFCFVFVSMLCLLLVNTLGFLCSPLVCLLLLNTLGFLFSTCLSSFVEYIRFSVVLYLSVFVC